MNVSPIEARDVSISGADSPRPRAFIYDRHATSSTAILDIRLDRCRAYAESQGWELAGIWIDLGDNALSDHRPEFHALCLAMRAEPGPAVCLVDDWDRIARDASISATMRRRVGQAGGHCETVGGESDAPEEKARGRLCTPH